MLKNDYLNNKIKIKKYVGLSLLTFSSGLVLSTLPAGTFANIKDFNIKETIEYVKTVDIKMTLDYLKLMRDNISLGNIDSIVSLNTLGFFATGSISYVLLREAYKVNEDSKAILSALYPNSDKKEIKQNLKDYKTLLKAIELIKLENKNNKKHYLLSDVLNEKDVDLWQYSDILTESKKATRTLSKIKDLDSKILILDKVNDMLLVNHYVQTNMSSKVLKP